MGADADTLIAGLLHDTVEDTDMTLKEIDKEFNGDVASLIDGVTKLESGDLEQYPTMDDQIETLRKIFDLIKKDVRVMVIKLVDRLHNIQTIQHLTPERQKSMAKETLDVFVKIADRLSMQALRDELEGLCISLLHPVKHKKIVSLQEKNEKRGGVAMRTIEKKLASGFPTILGQTDLVYERKSWGRLEIQLKASASVATGVSDTAVSFICHDIQDCYEVLGALHQLWHRETLSFQDFINAPMINGYRGLHTTLILEDGTRVRCKIRTEEMYEYAREGIATLCFDYEARGLLDYLLPWTKRIAPLSKGSKEHSDAFWENLQNDILGDSIMMHGPHDEQISLPKESTALDGAFYLYGNRALRTKEIFINGQPAELFDALPNACALTATFSKQLQANLEWLQKVNTGIAATHIREGLSKAPASKKRSLGKEILESSMMKEAHVSPDELNVSNMKEQLLTPLNVKSLDDLYIQLAEGKIQPESVITILFPRIKKSRELGKPKRWTLNMTYDPKLVDNIVSIIRTNRPRKIVTSNKNNVIRTRAEYIMCDEEAEGLQHQLKAVLPKNQWSLDKTRGKNVLYTSLSILILLWGLDPVMAQYLLQMDYNLNPFDLTIIRFGSFFFGSAIFVGIYRLIYTQPFKRLSLFHPALLLSGIALFLTGLFTYLTLSMLYASQYILFIIAGLVGYATLRRIRSKKSIAHLIIAALLLLFALYITILEVGFSVTGGIFAVGSAFGFVLYTHVSMRYLEEVETIQARYPTYLFLLSVICLPLALLLLPASNISALSLEALLVSIAYVTLFSIVPYGIYFECMRRLDRGLLDTILPFACIWTFLGDYLIGQSHGAIIALPIILVATVILRFMNRAPRNHSAS
jgi:(p)ppGpp synthase/HD superfamily hydrolase/drug/metabolite transporter (DMT)-like permease